MDLLSIYRKITMKNKKQQPKLSAINSSEGSNTRVHPEVLKATKQLAAQEDTTVWNLVNLSLISSLKENGACPKTWEMGDS